jgi:isopenicillin N synthase-like dioxygenase
MLSADAGTTLNRPSASAWRLTFPPPYELKLGTAMPNVPIIDIVSLLENVDSTVTAAQRRTADEIGRACREQGFFYASGHGVSESLQLSLHDLASQFFAQPASEKQRIAMSQGGRAWRGYFAVGDELTSGQPDQKEGIYFGAELPPEHPRVRAKTPLHGPNLFPDIPQFAETVLEYMQLMTNVCHSIVKGISLSLGLPATEIRNRWTYDPTTLFRIFHYPPLVDSPPPQNPTPQNATPLWSVGEHTDYGLLTLLRQDSIGGLQIKSGSHWIDAPPIDGTFVCNIGDMLEKMTGGFYRSTPHRVRNRGLVGRLSFPFFFDPAWDAQISPLMHANNLSTTSVDRWDGANLAEIGGAYGAYLLSKVAKVFPDLGQTELR